jgi:hypothetical protein
MTEPGRVAVGVRAALHALDAALAEHRRALTLAAGRREAQRIPLRREEKAAARAVELALEQPVERPMRGLRLAETWLIVDRGRHRLAPDVHAEIGERELLVRGADWSARLVFAPGEGRAAAARAAVGRIAAAAAAAPERGAARLRLVTAAVQAHAAASLGAAAALAAADRDAAERHADRGRLDACIAELDGRIGQRRLGEARERADARDRLRQARLHLATAPEQPYAWIDAWPAELAGAILRDLPEDRVEEARPGLVRLAGAPQAADPLLALALADGGAVAAITPRAVVAATAGGAAVHPPDRVRLDGDTLRAGRETLTGIAEARPGRLGAVLDLVAAVSRLPGA